jgi:fructose/tagatose bisphosphate aldolase
MLATSEQYGAMLDAASGEGYALPAVNVTSSETLNGAMRGFAEAGSDGIIQVTTGAADFLSGAAGDMALGARALAEYARVLGKRYPVLIGLHTDHAPPEKFDAFVRPLIDESRRRRARGQEPLFNSHMFDGSTLPLAKNLRISARLPDELEPLGLVLEVESGVVGGEEDGIAGPHAGSERLYTTTDDLMAVVDTLVTGERGHYLPAATFGNVHGVHAPGHVRLRPSLLRDARSRSPSGDRARGSGTSSTAGVAQIPRRSARRSRTASSRSTSTPTPSTPTRARSPATCSATTTACSSSTASSPASPRTTRAPGAASARKHSRAASPTPPSSTAPPEGACSAPLEVLKDR